MELPLLGAHLLYGARYGEADDHQADDHDPDEDDRRDDASEQAHEAESEPRAHVSAMAREIRAEEEQLEIVNAQRCDGREGGDEAEQRYEEHREADSGPCRDTLLLRAVEERSADGGQDEREHIGTHTEYELDPFRGEAGHEGAIRGHGNDEHEDDGQDDERYASDVSLRRVIEEAR